MEALENMHVYVEPLHDGNCQQYEFDINDFIDVVMAPVLERACQGCIHALNMLGGDFRVTTSSRYQAVVENVTHCPGLTHQRKNAPFLKCDELEQMIKKSLKELHSGLDANFVGCACDRDAHCEIIFSFDP